MLLRAHRTFPNFRKSISRTFAQALEAEENEYTDTPVYPPILDMSLQGRKLREREALHQNIQKINTVEEKQIALNMPRYYGWQSIVFNENKIPYNAMPLVQYYTRTHFKQIEKLPDLYTGLSSMSDTVVQEIKTYIEDSIAIEKEGVEYVLFLLYILIFFFVLHSFYRT